MDRKIGGHRIALNSLDIASIGAGGGSIARVDAGGILHVGPESAGAVPGPACYGQGGTSATVTDANLVLGYLDPANFLGGDAPARPRGRPSAPSIAIAAALGIDRLAAARGIHRIVNTNMAEGVRLVSVRRGVDPRRFALFAFGGAAGLHATDIARQLELARVIVPRVAAVLSAWGMLATDLRFEVVAHAISATPARSTAPRSSACSTRWRPRACARLRASFAGPARATPLGRYALWRAGVRDHRAARRRRLVRRRPAAADRRAVSPPARGALHLFDARPGKRAGQRARDRLRHSRRIAAGAEPARLRRQPRRRAERRIYLDELGGGARSTASTRSHRGSASPARRSIESAMTTVLLRPGDTAVVTPQGWLDIAIRSG